MSKPLTAEERRRALEVRDKQLAKGDAYAGSYDSVAEMDLHNSWRLLATIELLEAELVRLRNMDPGEFEDEYVKAHPFVCDWCAAGSAEKCEVLHDRSGGGCLTMVRSKIRGTKFYCSCEWRPEDRK